MPKLLLVGLLAFAILTLGVIQLVPYGRAHANPAVRAEPPWDSPQTRDLAVRACFDCHSNGTVWPWYSNIAPVSWMVQRDVEEGRAALNLSEWDRPQEEAAEAAETVSEGEMPPRVYLLTHPDARLGEAETQALIDGLRATLGADEQTDGRNEEDD
jgi:hypothetical protein